MLDESGKIVGVVVKILTSRAARDVPQNVIFVVSLDSLILLELFCRHIGFEFSESVEQVSRKPRDIATSARQYTVATDCWK